MSRWVQVDDSESGLRYSSGWSAIPGDQYNNQGNFGSTYLNTLHSATTAASFTYAFNGADGQVWGTINISKNSAGVIDPTWECLVDGKSIPLKDPFPFTENNWILCSWDSSTVPSGQHTLTVNVKSSGRAFLFDYFNYVPSPNANVNNAGIRLPSTDSALKYGAGWQVYGNNLGMLARAGGAPVSLTFYGTGIMWYGTAPTELPHGDSIASYTIDGKPSTTFTVPGTPDQNTQYVRFYFQTPSLPLGHHTIVVTSGGLSSQTPMVLSYLIVQGGSVQEPAAPNTAAPPTLPTSAQPGSSATALPPTASSLATNIMVSNGVTVTQTQLLPPSISTATGASDNANFTGIPNTGQPASTGNSATLPTGGTNSDSSNASAGKSTVVNGSGSGTPIGAIVGGVLGSLLLIAVIVLLAIFWRRRKTRQQRALEKVQVQQPFYSDMSQSQSAFNVVHPDEASSSRGESTFHETHTYHPQHGGNAQGTFTKNRPSESNDFANLRADLTPSTPGFSHYQISSNATTYSRGPESTVGSEATLSSVHGSVAPLLPAERTPSKHAEYLAESSSQAYAGYYTPTSESSTSPGRVVNHEDSGYRIRPAGPTQALNGAVLEFPPAYTTA